MTTRPELVPEDDPTALPSSVAEILEAEIGGVAERRAAESAPDQPFVEGSQDTIDADLRHRLISEAAYRHYVDRGYADGYDLDDWLQAETEVDHILLTPRYGAAGRA